jgi:hypothetical protein
MWRAWGTGKIWTYIGDFRVVIAKMPDGLRYQFFVYEGNDESDPAASGVGNTIDEAVSAANAAVKNLRTSRIDD